ncbi:MAG: hypothetical protein EPO25_11055 [Gammaproteobacteria bacterium]|nr:MAG: hypothetical protein EPO25_11055 [Gammaproteobacteria bacterium]
MWLVGLPVARRPLWQLLQLPITWLWSTRAGIQPLVVWQVSQALLVATWADPLPLATLPL